LTLPRPDTQALRAEPERRESARRHARASGWSPDCTSSRRDKEDAMTDAVRYHVELPGARDRWSVLFRPILIIPHAILVGGPFVGLGGGAYRTGALGLLAMTSAFFDWVSILFTGHPVTGLQPFKRLYLSWRARVMAYACFLRDEYPPFGEGPYPAWLELPDEPETRDFKAVLLRPLLLLPHLIVLFCLLVVQLLVCIGAWFAIVFKGRMGENLWRFSRDVMAYALRVEAYALLIHDRFPSFALSVEADDGLLARAS
jgi:hypothetical protein